MSLKTLLRLATAGSVDDGKSTLIGRLLYDTGNIPVDQIDQLVERDSKEEKKLSPSLLALVTDGLKAEREQNITIDVAYRYFSSEKRTFILADTPGHEQYTRNMATGCSTANVVLLLVDVTKGVLEQTKRHALIADLLQVPRIVLAVNKMDLVDYREKDFRSVRESFLEFSKKLSVKQIDCIPVSALCGDNIATRSDVMPWYSGKDLLSYLDSVYIGSDTNTIDLRMPVQYVVTSTGNKRRYTGKLCSGSIKVGDDIVVLPSGVKTQVATIEVPKVGKDELVEEVTQAKALQSIAVTTTDERDISRGDLITRSKNLPTRSTALDSLMIWFDTEPLQTGKRYILKHTSTERKATVTALHYRMSVESLSREDASDLDLNDIGRVQIELSSPLFYDTYLKNRETGSFILIDEQRYKTVGAGMIINRGDYSKGYLSASELTKTDEHASQNLHTELSDITVKERAALLKQDPLTLWFTGLSGSGKSTLAKSVEKELYGRGRVVYRLDGDNIRMGLNRDLGFSAEERLENIRRVAEVAKLFNDAGIIVLCSFISPLNEHRELARTVIGEQFYKEIFLSTPLKLCEERDPHGLYQKARSGEIPSFTGVSAPFEEPSAPTLDIDTGKVELPDAVSKVLKLLE